MKIITKDEPSCSPQRCEKRLSAIRPYLTPGGVGAELGVFKGAFSEYLLSTQPRKLYLVDPWYRLFPEWKWAKGERSTVAAFSTIIVAYRREIEQGLVEPVVEFSEVFLGNLPDRSLDWVYIDTSHKYEQTMKELTRCLTKVKPSGHIIGDDFYEDPDSIHHGVCRAVRELEKAGKIKVVMAGVADQFVARIV